MPLVARVFMRTSLLMLVAGIGIGAAGVAERAWRTHERSVTHTHLLLVGSLITMVIGVAWWMFPRVPDTVPRAPWVFAGRAVLNGGLPLRGRWTSSSSASRARRRRCGGPRCAPARGRRAAGGAAVVASAGPRHAASPAGRFLSRYSPIAPR